MEQSILIVFRANMQQWLAIGKVSNERLFDGEFSAQPIVWPDVATIKRTRKSTYPNYQRRYQDNMSSTVQEVGNLGWLKC